MMFRLSFNENWVNWIKVCLKSTSMFVLVNDSPTTKFKPTRGLR